MTVTPTAIPDVLLIELTAHPDARGEFFEGYRRDRFTERGITVEFVQDNHSRSATGVIRGLHYQLPPKAQAKLVQVTHGAIFDVAVDLRPGSPTRGQWVGERLSQANHRFLYLPAGFAHGYCALADGTCVSYKVSDVYSPAHERGIRWDDPALRIAWPPLAVPYQVSDRDQGFPLFRDAAPLPA